MDSKSETPARDAMADPMATATSELNNLLQIISNTSALVERGGESEQHRDQHFATLRATIERAEKLAADLATRAGGAAAKEIINPEFMTSGKQHPNFSSKTKKPWIIVVDDEQVTLGLVSRILTEAGYQVTTAQSGFECLDHFRPHPFQYDLVLLDLTMPFMDGEETFRRLRELRPDMPVVMCTGFIQQERLQGLMAAGLAGFLRKPVAPDEIVTHIRSILANVKYSRFNVDQNSVPVLV